MGTSTAVQHWHITLQDVRVCSPWTCSPGVVSLSEMLSVGTLDRPLYLNNEFSGKFFRVNLFRGIHCPQVIWEHLTPMLPSMAVLCLTLWSRAFSVINLLWISERMTPILCYTTLHGFPLIQVSLLFLWWVGFEVILSIYRDLEEGPVSRGGSK
jgi:hypothetical protein